MNQGGLIHIYLSRRENDQALPPTVPRPVVPSRNLYLAVLQRKYGTALWMTIMNQGMLRGRDLQMACHL